MILEHPHLVFDSTSVGQGLGMHALLTQKFCDIYVLECFITWQRVVAATFSKNVVNTQLLFR